MRVVEVSVRRAGSASDSLVGGECAGVGLGRTASPDVSIEVAFIVDWADISGSGVGAHVVVSLIIFVRVSLRTLGLGNDVFASVLAFKKSLEVVVIALASSVVEEFTGTSHCVVPVSSDRLFAISKTKRLGADGLRSGTANVVVRLTFVSGRTVRVGRTSLIGSSDLERSSVGTLKLGAVQFAFGSRLEVVEVSESSVVREGNATALFSVIVVTRRG